MEVKAPHRLDLAISILVIELREREQSLWMKWPNEETLDLKRQLDG